MSCHKELLHYKSQEPVLGRKKTKSYGFFFSESLYVARTIKERRWMRSTMSESNLISFLSQFVNSVNRCLCTDAGINDVSLSLLSALVALSQASSLLSFIISITKKRGRGGIWKKRWDTDEREIKVWWCAHAPIDSLDLTMHMRGLNNAHPQNALTQVR